MLIINEKIKASEFMLTGLHGEDLGIVSRAEALELAKKHKADLVCTSLMSSPPPCKLVARGSAKSHAVQDKGSGRSGGQLGKTKEIRLNAHTEKHDYETKKRQAEKLLASGNSVQLVVRIGNPKEGTQAKELVEQMLKELAALGKRETGIQISGKGAAVRVLPV
jgi:translation initiation factor IF-3